jgi:formylglycine-generating enzyme required for sulfatase activity
MKLNQIIMSVLLFFAGLIIFSCMLIPSEFRMYIEPKMISVDEDLLFSDGPSFDTTFVPSEISPMPIIELEPYKIGKFELSNEEYEKFVEGGGYEDSIYWSEEGWQYVKTENWSRPLYWSEDNFWLDDTFSNAKDMPVHGISYYEAEAYCNWLSDKTNKNYRIPTSVQWKRAAKGPDPGTKYTYGNEYNESYAHYVLLEHSTFTSVSDYSEGKSYDGCYQMIGNVYEITYKPGEAYILTYSQPSGACSSPSCMKITMITLSCSPMNKSIRKFGVGLRICGD